MSFQFPHSFTLHIHSFAIYEVVKRKERKNILFGVQLYGLFMATTERLTDDAKPTFYKLVVEIALEM